jgi:hypothetical protein
VLRSRVEAKASQANGEAGPDGNGERAGGRDQGR